jgi:hypothetical protein
VVKANAALQFLKTGSHYSIFGRQMSLDLDRRRATHSSGRDCLSVDVICAVTRHENA